MSLIIDIPNDIAVITISLAKQCDLCELYKYVGYCNLGWGLSHSLTSSERYVELQSISKILLTQRSYCEERK